MRKTVKGVGWKLAVVLIALAAYGGLKMLEGRKSAFDAERKKPFMVVSEADEKAAAAAQKSDKTNAQPPFVPLTVGELREYLRLNDSDLDEGERKEMREFVNGLTYRPFKNADEIVEGLSEEIRDSKEERKKGSLAELEAWNKNRQLALAALNDEKELVKNRLNEVVLREIKNDPEHKGAPDLDADELKEKVKGKVDHLLGTSVVNEVTVFKLKKGEGTMSEKTRRALYETSSKEMLATWLKTVSDQIARRDDDSEQDLYLQVRKERIQKAEGVAQKQLKVAYTTFRDNVEKRIGEIQKSMWPTAQSPFYLGSVFDDGSGAYVIYQTCRTIALVVLVFAVLSVFLLLLRILPFFAHSSETLMQQIGEVFKSSGGGGGGAPQFAKSLIVSAAALGLGTAVVVAGNSISDKGTRASSGAAVVSDDWSDDDQSTPHRLRKTRRDGHTDDDGFKVEFNPKIIYPEPYLIEREVNGGGGGGGGTLTLQPEVAASLRSLAQDSALLKDAIALKDKVETVETMAGETKRKVDEEVSPGLYDLQTVVVPGLATRNDLNRESVFRGWQVFEMNRRMGSLEDNLGKTLAGLSDDLSNTNALLGRQNSGGRNILTTAGQFFFKGNRYMVSAQVWRALKSLMCGSEPCSGLTCNEPCKAKNPNDKDEVAAALNKQYILGALQSMIGEPPKSESDFMKALKERIDKQYLQQLSSPPSADEKKLLEKALDSWKSIILKYTRSSY